MQKGGAAASPFSVFSALHSAPAEEGIFKFDGGVRGERHVDIGVFEEDADEVLAREVQCVCAVCAVRVNAAARQRLHARRIRRTRTVPPAREPHRHLPQKLLCRHVAHLARHRRI